MSQNQLLSPLQLKAILELGLEPNHICILLFSGEIDLENYNGNAKIQAWKQALIRKGFLTEKYTLTEMGKNLVTQVKEGTVDANLKGEIRKAKDKISTDFTRWWEAFPSTDTFEHKGKKFKGSRSFKTKKDECEKKLVRILHEGEYTIDDLIGVLQYEVMLKKSKSLEEGKNKMSYMNNSYTYLHQRVFEGFMEEYRKVGKGDKKAFDDNKNRGTVIV